MGTMTFLLPAGITPEASRELERACVAGGPDSMPWPTGVRLAPSELAVQRSVNESGSLVVPWTIDSRGQLMGSSATLMERDPAYRLVIELARGKVNQLRTQVWDWRAGGLQMTPALEDLVKRASSTFGQAVVEPDAETAGGLAQQALDLSYQAGDQLVRTYTDQVFQIRRQRYAPLETGLGCQLGWNALADEMTQAVGQACNCVCLSLNWGGIEPVEGSYRWQSSDQLLDWAESRGLTLAGGPLIDFSSAQLPDWLWNWEHDLGSLARFMENYVATTVQRYRHRIRTWQLTAASNCGKPLSLGEDELLWLTVRLAEVARQVDPDAKIVVGIAQPWGEYMASEDRTHSPFVFADTLIRSGLNLSALDLELVMGVTPRGSYCRDLLDTSRLLDLYAILGVPLRVTLACPSAQTSDPRADPELRVAGGQWHGGFTPETQAHWAEAFVALAACKPYVQAVHWTHVSDAVSHQFPHCGLFDAAGQPKPVLQQIQQIRTKYLR